MKRTLAALVLFAAVPALAFAETGAKLTASTSAAATVGSAGTLETTAPERLSFHAADKPDVVMNYLSIAEFATRSDVAFHLGFFPAMFWGMVAPRPKIHELTVSYKDDAGAIQVATFRLSEDNMKSMEQVLYARARNACVRREYGACSPVVPPPPSPRTPLAPRPATETVLVPVPPASLAQAPTSATAPAEKADK